MIRALQLLSGLLLAIGGGWFIWLRKDSPGGVFNVTDTETLWLVAVGLVLTLLGLVLFLMGLSPRAKIEQINWRYPEPAPEIDLSGPAFADQDTQNEPHPHERPSWLQEAAEDLDRPRATEQDNANSTDSIIGATALGVAGGVAANTLRSKEDEQEDYSEGPAYPRDELPFERPRFGASDLEDTSDIKLVEEPMDFHNTSGQSPDSEDTSSSTTFDTPSNVSQEEQVIEEFASEMDAEFNDDDIETLALEAANAAMDEADTDADTIIEENENHSSDEDEAEVIDEDDAFEKQLGALTAKAVASTGGSAAIFALNEKPEHETEPVEIEGFETDFDLDVDEKEPDVEHENLDIETLETRADELGSNSPISDLEPIEHLDLESIKELEPVTITDDAEISEEPLDIVEESALESDVIEELEPVETLDEVELDIEDQSTETTTSEDLSENDEISATIEEFNSEIEALSPTQDLASFTADDLPELDTAEIDAFELESELPDIEVSEVEPLSITEAQANEEGINSEEETISEVSLEEADETPLEASFEDEEALETETLEEPLEIADVELPELEEEAELDVSGLNEDEPLLENSTPENSDEDLDTLNLSETSLEGETDASPLEDVELEELSDIEELDANIDEQTELETDEVSDISDVSDLNVLEEIELEELPEEASEDEATIQNIDIKDVDIEEPDDLPEDDLPEIEDVEALDKLETIDSLAELEIMEDSETAPELAASSSKPMDIQTLAETTMSGPHHEMSDEDHTSSELPPPAPISDSSVDFESGTYPRLQPIRDALDSGQLENADTLLADIRRSLVQEGDENTPELAELTALAGDHAAASGRPGGAKWLWRLALQRFGEADAIESAAAKAVSERLRQFEH